MKYLRYLFRMLRFKALSKSNIVLKSFDVNISRTTELKTDRSSTIILEDNAFLGRYVLIDVYENAIVNIGKNVHIGDFCIGRGTRCEIKIGDNTMLGPKVNLLATNHQYLDKNMLIKDQDINTTKNGISIGKDCWIGTGASILPGVKIGDGAVIGAMAVVSKDVEDYSVVAGNPAKVIKIRSSI